MGFCLKLTLVFVAVIVGIVVQQYLKIATPPELPKFDTKRYWGPGKPVPDDTKITKFTISFPEAGLDVLSTQLADTKGLVEPLEDVQFQYGFNSKKLKQVIDYWRNTYLPKWSTERLQRLNKFPQYKTKIQGLNIHYIHVVPKVTKQSTKVLPLLLLHGWPGSVVEFYDIIPILTTESPDRDFVFEVVAPSLPGYGFSDAPAKTGLNFAEIAVIVNNLMARLNHKKYFVQGGDWGAAVGMSLTTIHPENLLGYHSNFCGVLTPLSLLRTTIAELFPKQFVDEKYHSWYFPSNEGFKRLVAETGYLHIQATKPDTVGIALTQNPIGLAAYLLEKFSTWTNYNYRDLADGGLEKYFTLDKLLDNVMVYYITNSITSSLRLYKESLSSSILIDLDRIHTHVPHGCAKFKYEMLNQIDWVIQEKYKNLIHSEHYEEGGHFAAMQVPQVLAQDVFEFVKKVKLGSKGVGGI